MADLSDVSAALVAQAAQVLYPNGTGQASAAGLDVRIYPGWPVPEQLDADLRAATPTAHLSVWPRDEERNTTRYPAGWQQPTAPTVTLTATISGQTVTLGGTPAAGLNAAVLANGSPFVYTVQAGDTLTSIATALASLIAASIPGTASSGAVITLPTSARLGAARVGGSASMTRETRRQERQYQLSIWADTPAHRDTVAQLVDNALAALTFLVMPDGSAARIRYRGARQIDAQEKDWLYRRDLIYTVEYATTQTAAAKQIVTEQANLTAQDSNQAQIATATATVNF